MVLALVWCLSWALRYSPCRYEAFKSIGEKKSCFNEYLQQRANEEKDEKRRKEKQIREDFFTLLELSPEMRTGMRYSKAAALFEDEPRWQVRIQDHPNTYPKGIVGNELQLFLGRLAA